MDKNQNAIEQLKEGIVRYVKKALHDCPMDKTVTGVIQKENLDKTYDIKINGIIYTKVPTIGGTCHKYESVKVLIPQNQYNNMFILKGGQGGGGQGGAVNSVNGKTGDVVLNATDVGADISGSATIALSSAKSYTDSKVPTEEEKQSWNNKQDALDSQTPYTSKGSSSKVPKITTNNLGQVTNILEVDIDKEVYIGSTEPTEESVNIWVDPTDNPSPYPSGGSGHEYSMEEQVVGKWVDGRTIYEKTVQSIQTTGESSWSNFVKNDFNVKDIIDIRGIVNYNANISWCQHGYGRVYGEYLQVYVPVSFFSKDDYITIQYTKND